MKITRIKSSLTAILNDGTILSTSKCTDEMYEDVIANMNNDNAVIQILSPQYHEAVEMAKQKFTMLAELDKSQYLSRKDNSFYILSVAEISVPEDLAVAIWNAETEENYELLSSYLNFWTLAALNPDAEARKNLFWFLNRYGMSISRSGLFVAYRNVVLHDEGIKCEVEVKAITDAYANCKYVLKQDLDTKYIVIKKTDGSFNCVQHPEGESIQDMYDNLSIAGVTNTYTDGYTGTFRIKIGQPITMPRHKCDSNQNNTCSNGLHVAGKSWLTSNYFGDSGLRVLVNPADVVAVPPQDSYGKMRCCAYYPVANVHFDKNGNIVDEEINDGFIDNFIDIISYEGNINNEEAVKYSLSVPNVPQISKKQIVKRLKGIKESLKIKHNNYANY